MKYNLAIDSGGSKTAAILYDDSFHPVFRAYTGSVRGNTTSEELIDHQIGLLIGQLEEFGLTSIGRLGGSLDGRMTADIRKRYQTDSVHGVGELELGLAAAFISGDGMLILSGTGSDIISRSGGTAASTGGYGAAVGDSGSGYDLGRRAVNAAIEDYEGRGPHTLLSELVCRHFGKPDVRSAIFSIYSPSVKASPVASVASVSKLLDEAADMGDAAAMKILSDSGRVLGEQTISHMRRCGLDERIPTTISGGVWKGHRLFAESLITAVREEYPRFRITPPKFEPVIGAVLVHYFSEADKPDEALFDAEYGDFKLAHKPVFDDFQ